MHYPQIFPAAMALVGSTWCGTFSHGGKTPGRGALGAERSLDIARRRRLYQGVSRREVSARVASHRSSTRARAFAHVVAAHYADDANLSVAGSPKRRTRSLVIGHRYVALRSKSRGTKCGTKPVPIPRMHSEFSEIAPKALEICEIRSTPLQSWPTLGRLQSN